MLTCKLVSTEVVVPWKNGLCFKYRIQCGVNVYNTRRSCQLPAIALKERSHVCQCNDSHLEVETQKLPTDSL